jgi:hypothetical protein
MKPTVGRIVHYMLTSDDADRINLRRTTGSSIRERIQAEMWSLGAQAHIGNHKSAGMVLPMIVCRVWPDEYGPGVPGVNGQVFLDGNDQLWVTSAKEGPDRGQWNWPPRE